MSCKRNEHQGDSIRLEGINDEGEMLRQGMKVCLHCSVIYHKIHEKLIYGMGYINQPDTSKKGDIFVDNVHYLAQIVDIPLQ